ncbi:MAG: hypothetical protein AAF598_05795 [Bacteroidota bacterium]
MYVAVGQEGEIMEGVARSIHEKLADDPIKKQALFFQYFEEQDHGDALHLAVYDAFKKLFALAESEDDQR